VHQLVIRQNRDTFVLECRPLDIAAGAVLTPSRAGTRQRQDWARVVPFPGAGTVFGSLFAMEVEDPMTAESVEPIPEAAHSPYVRLTSTCVRCGVRFEGQELTLQAPELDGIAHYRPCPRPQLEA
jgi:hypothetical protein